MKTRTRTRSAPPVLSKDLRDLVQAPAESMDISLEVWNGPGRAADRLHLSTACAECQLQQRRTFDRCRKRRSYLARQEARVPESFSETCPRNQRLTRLAGQDASKGIVLFGFGYDAAESGSSLEADSDGSVVSFLEDVHLMLREPLENLTQIRNLSQARGQGLELLQSGMTQDGSGTHGLVERWRRVLQADVAFAWVPEQELLCVTGTRTETWSEEDRRSLALFARRHAEELQASEEHALLSSLPARHPVSKAMGGTVQAFGLPLAMQGDRRGMLCGLRAGGFPQVSEVESQLVQSLANELALQWSNAELGQGLKRFLANTVKTLVSAIEAKDSYTSGHSERVNIISMLLGNELDLDLEDLESLYWGALLHDVGKIGMPEAILNKPSPLEDDEYRVVREHPERGWRMLHSVPELARAATGIRHHHERWDGNGYPARLAGEDIPILSRIICVADAFDAIVSNRSYRKGQSPTRAVGLIEECAGEQFDPRVVQALRRLLPLLERHRWVLMSGQKTSFHY